MSNTGEDDDDDFQIPPSTQLSIRKPLGPTSVTISHRPPNKKPRLSRNPGKENVSPPPTPPPQFSSGIYTLSADLLCSSSTPHCIPSSVDCSAGAPICSLGEDDQVLVDKEKRDDCFKANREGYFCNSMEARLSKSRILLGFDGGIHEDEGFVESDSELDVLIKLCSESEGNRGECSLGNDDSIQCPLCLMGISALTEEQRQVHSNSCLDNSDNQAPEQDCLRKCDNASSFIEEYVDDPVQLQELVTDLSPVLKWLRSLGLAKYEDVFICEEIDWDTLQSLTEEDLLSIGITSLGPRKKIVNALSGLIGSKQQGHQFCTLTRERGKVAREEDQSGAARGRQVIWRISGTG